MYSSDHADTDSSPSGSTSPPCATYGKREELSPPDAAPSEKKPKVDENSLTIDMDKFLQCSVCLTFPASPIHACASANAHVVCGRCAPKHRACPTCKARKVALNPSPVSDNLAKEANTTIRCENFEAGCVEGVLSTKFPDHLSSCYYREITCDYSGLCELDVKFSEYIKHLEVAHDVEIAPGPKFAKTYRFKSKPPGKTWSFWEQSVINFDGQQFIVHAQNLKKSQLFFTWAGILGDANLAKKYICYVQLKDPKGSKKFGSSWRLNVSAFHELHYNDSEAKFLEYLGGSAVAVVPMAMLRKWGELYGDKIEVGYEIREA